MRVEIWSDVVCPWCYVGKRRFEAALSGFAHRDEVEVVWRSFELDPTAARLRSGAYVDRLAAKYAMSVSDAQAMIDHMVDVGGQNGLALDFGIARPGNTFDAHRLLHFAAGRGAQGALKERLLAATFTEGAPIGDVDVLVRLAGEVGLDADQARAVLEGDEFATAVRSDEQLAARLGISAVPFFVVAGTYGVSGAQPPEFLLRVLDDAWREAGAGPAGTAAEVGGGACSDDTCAVPQ